MPTSKLEEIILECKSFLTSFEVNRALQAVSNLKFGASSCQTSELPSCFCENSSNCSKYGVEITDTIANWSLKGFVAGPFEAPPPLVIFVWTPSWLWTRANKFGRFWMFHFWRTRLSTTTSIFLKWKKCPCPQPEGLVFLYVKLDISRKCLNLI